MPTKQTISLAINRRQFVSAAAAGAGVMTFPAILRARSPNDKLNVAIIGCGGRGAGNMNEMRNENIVALCDVNENNLQRAAQSFPQAKKFVDFRKLYDQLGDNEFDAVV